MSSGPSPELRLIRARYEQVSSGFATKLADLREQGIAFNEEMAEREAKAKEEAEKRRAERAAQEGKAKETDGKKPNTPENPWTQPRQRQGDTAARFGVHDDGTPPPRVADVPAATAESAPPKPEPVRPESRPEMPSRGRHAARDGDYDDFGGNVLRG